MKNIFRLKSILFISLFVLFSCSSQEEVNKQKIINETNLCINQNLFNSMNIENYNIHEADIKENILTVKIGSNSCSSDLWKIKLVVSENIAESLPPKRFAKLKLDDDEVCVAQPHSFTYYVKEYTFDIRSIRIKGNENKLILDLIKWNNELVYIY